MWRSVGFRAILNTPRSSCSRTEPISHTNTQRRVREEEKKTKSMNNQRKKPLEFGVGCLLRLTLAHVLDRAGAHSLSLRRSCYDILLLINFCGCARDARHARTDKEAPASRTRKLRRIAASQQCGKLWVWRWRRLVEIWPSHHLTRYKHLGYLSLSYVIAIIFHWQWAACAIDF